MLLLARSPVQYRPLLSKVIENRMKEELKEKVQTYYEFREEENWENLSDIKKIMWFKEKKKDE